RKAVSAVIPRLPCTISLIRRGGTWIDTASLFCVIPKPSMKSSMSTSPGWIGGIFSVVVNDLHLLWSGVGPHEADPPLVVDSDAVLTGPIALERFESVTGWDTQVIKKFGRSHLAKLAQRDPMDPRIDRPHALTTPQPFGLLAPERSGHATSI